MKKIPTEAEYKQLARDWKVAKDSSEKNRIATLILEGLNGLINKIVGRMAHKFGAAMHEDCFAEAQLSIVTNALPNYDEKKLGACKFTSYMSQWAFQSARRHLDSTSTPVRFPIDGRRRAIKARNNREQLTSDDRLHLATMIYWDRPEVVSGISEDGEQKMMDRICAEEGLSNYFSVHDNLNEQQEREIFECLLNEDAHLIGAKVVREYLQGKTFKQIGAELGLSRKKASAVYTEHTESLRQRVSLATAVKHRDGKHNQTPTKTRVEDTSRRIESIQLE